jgi:cell division septum initiation protein DivIVA
VVATNTQRLIAVVLLMAGTGSAWAQAARSGGGANAQIAQQYQQALSDRSAAQAENTKLKADLEDAKKRLADLTKRAASAKASAASQAALAAAQAASRNSEQTLEQNKVKMQELIGRFRESTASIAGLETDNNQLKQKLAASVAQYDQCTQRNVELYELSNQVLDRLQHQGVWGAMARAEPFAQIKRTQLDNLVVEDRQHAQELKIQKPAVGDAPAKSGAGHK